MNKKLLVIVLSVAVTPTISSATVTVNDSTMTKLQEQVDPVTGKIISFQNVQNQTSFNAINSMAKLNELFAQVETGIANLGAVANQNTTTLATKATAASLSTVAATAGVNVANGALLNSGIAKSASDNAAVLGTKASSTDVTNLSNAVTTLSTNATNNATAASNLSGRVVTLEREYEAVDLLTKGLKAATANVGTGGCSPEGALARTTSGVLTVCHGSMWKNIQQ